MHVKSTVAELVWLLRLKQGTFFEPQLTADAFSPVEPAPAMPAIGGEADSQWSVLTRASETTGDEGPGR